MIYFFDFPKIGYFNFNIYGLSAFEFVSCIFALSINMIDLQTSGNDREKCKN